MMPALPLALAALVAGAPEASPVASPDGGPRTALTTVSGILSSVAYPERRFTVATEQGPATLTFDRNTAVYLPRRMGTARDLAPGQPVRAAHGADGRAYWVEIRTDEEAVPPSAAAPPGEASGPAVLPPPALAGAIATAAPVVRTTGRAVSYGVGARGGGSNRLRKRRSLK